jgi:hypothetical protein
MKWPATDMGPDPRFRRREIANNEVRLSYLENDGDATPESAAALSLALDG